MKIRDLLKPDPVVINAYADSTPHQLWDSGILRWANCSTADTWKNQQMVKGAGG